MVDFMLCAFYHNKKGKQKTQNNAGSRVLYWLAVAVLTNCHKVCGPRNQSQLCLAICLRLQSRCQLELRSQLKHHWKRYPPRSHGHWHNSGPCVPWDRDSQVSAGCRRRLPDSWPHGLSQRGWRLLQSQRGTARGSASKTEGTIVCHVIMK